MQNWMGLNKKLKILYIILFIDLLIPLKKKTCKFFSMNVQHERHLGKSRFPLSTRPTMIGEQTSDT